MSISGVEQGGGLREQGLMWCMPSKQSLRCQAASCRGLLGGHLPSEPTQP